MLDSLPLNCFQQVVKLLPQKDRVALTYVSHELYERTVVYLYRNICLNQKPEFQSDLDVTIHEWSLLNVPWSSNHEIEARNKLRFLLRSLESNIRLCDNIRSIHCSWHSPVPILTKIIALLGKYASKLEYFDGFLDNDIMCVLSVLAPRLKSLVVLPPQKVPQGRAPPEYYAKISSLIYHYDLSQITVLDLYAQACVSEIHLPKRMKVRELRLELRPDTFESESLVPYSRFLDTSALRHLHIISWYSVEDSNADLYDKWLLHDLHEFHEVRTLTLTSLHTNEEFLVRSFESFPHLERCTADYLLDARVSQQTMNRLQKAACSRNLKSLDVRFDLLSPPILSIDEPGENFVLKLNCPCSGCRQTYHEVVRKKYFPSSDKLRIKSFPDINARHFILQMFKLFPIVAHPLVLGKTPPIAYSHYSLQKLANKVNMLLGYDELNPRRLLEDDIQSLYYAHLHSMRKTFDYFSQAFQNLQYLTLNDIPTLVKPLDDYQRCNIPVFHSRDYRSNQVYELVSDESLFD